MMKYLKTNNGITVIHDGTVIVIPSSDSRYDEIIKAIESGVDDIKSIAQTDFSFEYDGLSIEHDPKVSSFEVFYMGRYYSIPDFFSNWFKELKKEGLEPISFCKFFKSVIESGISWNELVSTIEEYATKLSEDGNLILWGEDEGRIENKWIEMPLKILKKKGYTDVNFVAVEANVKDIDFDNKIIRKYKILKDG